MRYKRAPGLGISLIVDPNESPPEQISSIGHRRSQAGPLL